ncbi:hypothetical protein AB6A40_004515 [Gnathostoma spinigerum]|uniref:Uncharacterized protein n=1 Tax=Gnathostoma spinigerum TaxID=75299 RepID=A0ABD6EF06_9BILA
MNHYEARGSDQFLPLSLKCRLSVIEGEVRRALQAENYGRIDEVLLKRSVDIGVGSVGTSSPSKLIAVAYNLYKQQSSVNEFEKTCAELKHYAQMYLDEDVEPAERIYYYIVFKLPNGAQTASKKIREAIRCTKVDSFEEWKEMAYSRLTGVPRTLTCVKVVLQDLYIASIASLTAKNYEMMKMKSIDCVIAFSEFGNFGYDVRQVFPNLKGDNLIVIDSPLVLTLPLDLFISIHQMRTKGMHVCIACDTTGLTISGLIVARYLSLLMQCSHADAVGVVSVSHKSFHPKLFFLSAFNTEDCDLEECRVFKLQAPSSSTMHCTDRKMFEKALYMHHHKC